MSNFKLTLGLVILAFICLLALVEPLIIQQMFPGENPIGFGAYMPFGQPSPKHLLGPDQMGRDAVAALLIGLRQSCWSALRLVLSVARSAMGCASLPICFWSSQHYPCY